MPVILSVHTPATYILRTPLLHKSSPSPSCTHFPPSSHSPSCAQVRRLATRHVPDEATWSHVMQPVHDSLAESGHGAPEQLSESNSQAALQEFSFHGQAALDDLLDALDGGLEVGGQGGKGARIWEWC